MPRIRHIALLTKQQEKLADFYKTAFGMTEVFRHESQAGGGPAIYLSDGYINLAVLPARERPEGLYHFGFQVDDVDRAAQGALNAGATQPPKDLPRDGRFAEVFIKDPMGTRIDLSEAGWKV
ncbi:MAG TPA: VOC family protein [Candidatus Binatia bacterium]|nr:VOC family protein [Candidatus Binatia bacterium]